MSSVDSESSRPVILNSNIVSDRKKLGLYRRKALRVVDAVPDQLDELYCIRHPASILTGINESDKKQFIQTFLKENRAKDHVDLWIWYPWKRTLVHLLSEEIHTEIRTSRNRNLVTKEEQELFYRAHIGIAGLSVGNSVLGTILHAGGGKYLRIADSDTLSGSNLNRIRTGIDSIGLPKTTIASREIYEVNPFADLQTYPDGLTTETIEKFLLYPTPLSIVIDEMDSLYLKIQLRIHARAHKIPVIMAADNGDGVVVDIERYDIDPHRPLMHGDISEVELRAITPNTTRAQAARIISAWVKPENIAERMMVSLMQLGKTLYTWPQLGNAATLAGATMCYVARRIITHQPINQGKFVFTPDSVFIPDYHTPEYQKHVAQIRKQFLHSD